MSKTVNHKKIMELGFPQHTARNIIRQAKAIAVAKFEETSNSTNNLIKLSKSPFENVRLDLAPTDIVEELLGFQLPSENRKELKNGK